MKKIIFTIGIVLIASFTMQAQSLSKNALGLRMGDGDGLGYEISYQRALTKATRMEFDLGLRNSNNVDAYKLSAIHQWVWDLSQLAPGFNWFAGAGGAIGSWENSNNNGQTFINASGNIGLEYNLNIPLQLTLDTRPELGIVNGDSDLFLEIALGVRYKF